MVNNWKEKGRKVEGRKRKRNWEKSRKGEAERWGRKARGGRGLDQEG